MESFLPVILGSDVNAYGIARSIYERFHIKSVCLASAPLLMTESSQICSLRIRSEIHSLDGLKAALLELANETSYQQRIVFAASDEYAQLLIKLKRELSKYYKFPVPQAEVVDELVIKEKFYGLCDELNLPHPKTQIVTAYNYSKIDEVNFKYPIVVKPSNSVSFFKLHFHGKKKAYILKNEAELKDTLSLIYGTGYTDNLVIQEFIPGDDTNMRVVNTYIGQNHRVQAVSIGQPLLEDVTPELIGNYVAVKSVLGSSSIIETVKKLLEYVGYTGLADIDFKYDRRTNEYKIFDVNLRAGRSSYYTTLAGCNVIACAIDDLIYNNIQSQMVINSKDMLWLGVPAKVACQYIEDPALRQEATRLIKEGHYGNTLCFSGDKGIKRNYRVHKYYKSYIGRFRDFFEEKGE